MRQFFRTRTGIVIITIAVVLLLVFFQRWGFLHPVENLATAVLRPVQTALSTGAQRLKRISVYVRSIRELRDENSRLASENGRVTAENVKLKEQLENTGDLQKQLAFVTEHTYQSVSAKVIGRSADQYLQMIIINKGDASGIAKGYPVITDNGILIGKVVDTNSQIAKVQLLTDNASEVGALIENEDKSPGVVKGEFGLSLHMVLIPQDHLIANEQLVVTSGLDDAIPANFLIGKISEITKREGELFQEAQLQPLLDYDSVSIVTVIIPPNETNPATR